MKITHICLCGPVTDNWMYQDNLLSKYHKKLGNSVSLITSQYIWNDKGKLEVDIRSNYFNDHGVKMIRLEAKNKTIVGVKLRMYKNLYETICMEKPDIIFVHGVQFLDIKHVVKYVKVNPNVRVYVDNHADFNNSARNFLSKNILHKIIWRYCAHLIEPYTTKFYGVLPARVDFLKKVYKIPDEKVDLLVMGVDDDIVEDIKQKQTSIREKHGIEKDDFLIVTGGKIDNNKLQTLLLMEAINEIKNPKVKLLVFGSVVPEHKNKFNKLLSDNVMYVGWLESKKIYEYFNDADLIVFPGSHSVLWEQAVGLGKPCVFRYMEGFTHIDLGGNCKFIYEDSVKEIKLVINEILHNQELYESMKTIARNKGMNTFSYRAIAEKSIS